MNIFEIAQIANCNMSSKFGLRSGIYTAGPGPLGSHRRAAVSINYKGFQLEFDAVQVSALRLLMAVCVKRVHDTYCTPLYFLDSIDSGKVFYSIDCAINRLLTSQLRSKYKFDNTINNKGGRLYLYLSTCVSRNTQNLPQGPIGKSMEDARMMVFLQENLVALLIEWCALLHGGDGSV